jgi:AcrR family transcriptional regulator
MGKRATSKEETREALIRAGTELFAEQGLDAPSLDGICERAGFTRGAFYVHFKDRDDFLVAVMDRVGSEFLQAVLANTAGEPSIVRAVKRFVESVERGEYPLMRKGGVRPHQLLAACARSPAIRARYVALVQQSIGMVEHLVADAKRSGVIRTDAPPDHIAMVLLAAVVGAQTMMDLGVEVDLAQAARTLMLMLGIQE